MNTKGLKVLALASLAVLAGQAHADYEYDTGVEALYWQIDSKNEIEFDYAVLYAVKTSDISGKEWSKADGYGEGVSVIALPAKSEDGLGMAYESINGMTTMDITTALQLDNPSSYAFFIELLQWDEASETETRLGVSNAATYTDLTNNRHINFGEMSAVKNLVVWAPMTYAPEPTSGLLALIGLSLLALRRKQHA